MFSIPIAQTAPAHAPVLNWLRSKLAATHQGFPMSAGSMLMYVTATAAPTKQSKHIQVLSHSCDCLQSSQICLQMG